MITFSVSVCFLHSVGDHPGVDGWYYSSCIPRKGESQIHVFIRNLKPEMLLNHCMLIKLYFNKRDGIS